MTRRDNKVNALLRRLIANFIARESDRQALISVSAVVISGSGGQATVYITVLPSSGEIEALKFLHQRGRDIQDYVRERVRMRAIPFFNFLIDDEEKRLQ